MIRTSPVLLLLSLTTVAEAQPAHYPEYADPEPTEIERPEPLPTPREVRQLELETAVPPCGGRYRGRSRLDGGLASRARDPDLPCRDVWQRTVRFEIGLLGGGIVGRGNGGG